MCQDIFQHFLICPYVVFYNSYCLLRTFARQVAKIHKHYITLIYTEFSYQRFKDTSAFSPNPDVKFVTALYCERNIEILFAVSVKNSDVLPVSGIVFYRCTYIRSLEKLRFYMKSGIVFCLVILLIERTQGNAPLCIFIGLI